MDKIKCMNNNLYILGGVILWFVYLTLLLWKYPNTLLSDLRTIIVIPISLFGSIYFYFYLSGNREKTNKVSKNLINYMAISAIIYELVWSALMINEYIIK